MASHPASTIRNAWPPALRNGSGEAWRQPDHPKQVPIVNECYAPTAAEVAWAKRVLDASDQANGAAISIDGKMVDRPVVLRAQRVVDWARA